MHDYTEEDFRLATAVQVRNYSTEELQYKPHLPGFGFTQLLDQLDGHALKTVRPCFYLRATRGTGYWVAKHLLQADAKVSIVLSTALNLPTVPGQYQLEYLTGALEVRQESELGLDLGRCVDVTCVVLAGPVCELHDRYRQVREHSLLRRKLTLAFDPCRYFARHKEGEYFMGSSIWVTRDYRNFS